MRSARLTHQGTDEWVQARELASHIPMGQPDLVDHHSYPRTRRLRERIHRMQDRAIGDLTAGERAGQAADAAQANQRHHLNGATTERRIHRLEAHARDLARKISRAQASNDTEARAGLEPRAAQVAGDLAYWKTHLAKPDRQRHLPPVGSRRLREGLRALAPGAPS